MHTTDKIKARYDMLLYYYASLFYGIVWENVLRESNEFFAGGLIMFCAQCGTQADDGARFCSTCGAALQVPGGMAYQPPPPSQPSRPAPRAGGGAKKQQDPYQQQIKQLKLEIRQLKLDLKQINTQMSSIRSGYNETAAFVPRGILRRGDKMIEDARLLGPQKKKQQLQQQIMQLEQQLLSLQQQQQQWQQD